MLTVLLVDDQVSITRGLEQMLQDDGHTVFVEHSAEQALQRIEECTIDLLLTDLRLPGMTGLECVRMLQTKSPGTKTILMSAYVTLEDAIEAVRLGVLDIFPKPFQNQAILSRIQAFEKSRSSVNVAQVAPQRAAGQAVHWGQLKDYEALHGYAFFGGKWYMTQYDLPGEDVRFAFYASDNAKHAAYLDGCLEALTLMKLDLKSTVQALGELSRTPLQPNASFVLIETVAKEKGLKIYYNEQTEVSLIPLVSKALVPAVKMQAESMKNPLVPETCGVLLTRGPVTHASRRASEKIQATFTTDREESGRASMLNKVNSFRIPDLTDASQDPFVILCKRPSPEIESSLQKQVRFTEGGVDALFANFQIVMDHAGVARAQQVRAGMVLAETVSRFGIHSWSHPLQVAARSNPQGPVTFVWTGADNLQEVLLAQDEPMHVATKFCHVPDGAQFLKLLQVSIRSECRDKQNRLVMEIA